MATVKNGLVTAVKAGKATITCTAKDGGTSATCTVTVTEPDKPVIDATDDFEDGGDPLK